MKQVSAEQKLALVRQVRMDNQYNQMKCKEREHTLSLCYPEQDFTKGTKKKGISGFSVRVLLSIMLLLAFLYMAKTDQKVLGKSCKELTGMLSDTMSLPFDF